jgi:hypothetical protein
MKRRRLLQALGLPALAALGGAAYAAVARARNPYYGGPSTDHFDGVRFFTPGQPPDKGLAELLRWQLGGGRANWPETFPNPFQDRPPARVDGLRVALVGHATLLIQVAGLNILADPVYAERASPLSFAGPRRVNPPGVAFDDLPPIDAVLLTHNPTTTSTWRLFRACGGATGPAFSRPWATTQSSAGTTRPSLSRRAIGGNPSRYPLASRRIWSRAFTGRRGA